MEFLFARVNLNSRAVTYSGFGSLLMEYLGGRGLGVRILIKEIEPTTPALSPENKLIFATTPLLGTGAPSFVKYSVVTKSPLTGTILMSLAGGFFGSALRKAGLDGLIIEGKSPAPVFLWIHDGQVEIRDASQLWGMRVSDTVAGIRRLVDQPKAQVAAVGPAGERGVRYASIISDDSAAGRGGAGTVMGAKNLKAIAALGRKRLPVARPGDFAKARQALARQFLSNEGVVAFGKYGTPGNVRIVNARGVFPTMNYHQGTFEGAERIDGTKLVEMPHERFGCYGCPIRCRKKVSLESGPYAGTGYSAPEYETLWAFGADCGNDNLEAIIAANQLCSELGLDTISTGNAIAFAMQLFELGQLKETDTDGLRLQFGNQAAIVSLVEHIGMRRGFGRLLGEGVRRAAEALGHDAERFAMHVKGMEISGYAPRAAKGMALGYATSPRGACHERAFLPQEAFGAPPHVDPRTEEGKGAMVKARQDEVAVLDSLGFCVLAGKGARLADLLPLWNGVTGFDQSEADLLAAGEHICNLERVFNLKAGFSASDDTLPEHFLVDPLPDGPARGEVVDLSRLITDYYAARGWGPDGVPTAATLKRLHLDEAAVARSGFTPHNDENKNADCADSTD